MIKKLFYILIVVFILFNSCIRNDSDQNNQAFCDLNSRFPEFPKNEGQSHDFYKFLRSVKNGQKNFEVQLYSTPYQKGNNHEILVITNKLGKRYALPLFSNKNKMYWNFEFENINNSKGLTFKNELTTALDTLQLNDTLGTAQHVVFEIFSSLLRLRSVDKCDFSKRIIEVPDKVNSDAYSCESECDVRINKIDSTLVTSCNSTKKENHWYPIFIDFKRKRAYQLDFPRYGKIDSLTLHVYRTDCNCIYIGFNL